MKNKKAYDEQRTAERIIALIDSEFDSDASFEREVGLAPKTVNNWRRGRSASFMKMLPKLAETFEVSVTELLDVPLSSAGQDLSEDEIELLTLYRKCAALTARQKLALSKTLENVINLYLSSIPEKRKARAKREDQ